MESVNQLNIFSYSDYRDCLADYYRQTKLQHRSFSLQTLANRVGLSKMAIKYLIDKKRHSTEDGLPKLAQALGLNRREQLYFHYLALFNKAKEADRKQSYLQKMINIQSNKFRDKNLKEADLGIFSNWITPAIMELSYVDGFKKSPEWIQQAFRFKVPIQSIRDSLEFIDKKKYFENSSLKMKLPDEVRSFIYKRYVHQMIEKSLEALETQDSSEREFFNITISVNEERHQMAMKMISDFRHKLHDTLASDEVCDKVIQINMQMFIIANGRKKQ